MIDSYYMIAIEQEINRRTNDIGKKIHDEDLVHFLMADFRLTEKKSRKLLKHYISLFS